MSAAPVPGSNLYGRKYKLEVATPSASGTGTDVITVTDSDFEPEALRIVFDINMPAMYAPYWYASIDIYNLDQATEEKLVAAGGDLAQGMSVKLQAGYQNGNFDIIWQGPVFQPLWVRENVVDYKITLHCILGLDELSRTAISGQYSAQTSQTEIILDMLRQVGMKQDADLLSSSISKKPLIRGKSIFGSADNYLTQIAEDNNMVWFRGMEGVTVGSLNDGQTSAEPSTIYTPDTGLIGTPEQTQLGVDFTVLLDPRLKAQIPLMTVKLDQASIRFTKKQIGELPGLLDRDGVYVVGAVRHRGDSRGIPWYTEVTGYTKVGNAVAWDPQANISN